MNLEKEIFFQPSFVCSITPTRFIERITSNTMEQLPHLPNYSNTASMILSASWEADQILEILSPLDFSKSSHCVSVRSIPAHTAIMLISKKVA